MSGRHKCLVVFIVLLVFAGALRGQDTAVEELTPAERLYGLSLIWKEADYNFPRFADLPALDTSRFRSERSRLGNPEAPQHPASTGKNRCLPPHTWSFHADTG